MNKMNKLIALPIGDFIFSIFALYSAFFLRFGSIPETEEISNLIEIKFLIFGLTLVFLSFIIEMYNQEKNSGKKELLLRVFIGIVIAFLLLSSLYYMIPSIMLGRGLLFISLVSFGLFQFLWHFSYRALKIHGLARKILILGTGPLAHKIGEIIKSTNHHYVLAGYVNLSSEAVCVPVHSILTNGNGNDNGNGLIDIAKKEKAHKIVVSLSERRGVFPLKEVLSCKFSGIEVVDAPSLYEEMTGKLLIEEIKPSWFIFSDGFRITNFKRISKRILDIFMALIGLLITLPLFPFIALFTKIDSSGPIFFKQLRVGERGKVFTIYKFRTMHHDAEKGNVAVWAQKKDSRVTRTGKILRKIRLDEFPQFYNVLKGDMSIVGPRPERPEFIDELEKLIPYYSERHFAKPGITGWAQIRYPYGSSIKDSIEKLRYDLYYIKHLSLFFDAIIIMETIKVMLFGRGAR